VRSDSAAVSTARIAQRIACREIERRRGHDEGGLQREHQPVRGKRIDAARRREQVDRDPTVWVTNTPPIDPMLRSVMLRPTSLRGNSDLPCAMTTGTRWLPNSRPVQP
jgi:hypothetical protein